MFWEALGKFKAVCPRPVILIPYWGAARCLHYPSICKKLLCSFPTKGRVHTLGPHLISWPVPWRVASLQHNFSGPESKVAGCLLLELNLRRGPCCVAPVGCFSGKVCLSGCAALSQHPLRGESPTSETDSQTTSSTHIPVSPHSAHFLKWRWAPS